MELPNAIEKGQVFMTCTMDQVHTWENVSPHHIIGFIFSGELTITYGTATLTFVAGDTLLVPKNQLSRSTKSPVDGAPFKCLSVVLPEQHLRKFYQDHAILETWTENISRQRPVTPAPLLQQYFTALLPYFDMQDALPEALVPIKIQELLTIVDNVDKRASAILGTFREVGKIDLEKYMEEHFMYNLPLEKFAFLTGRSLSTFKSDFRKVFQTTPGKWLTQKRLNLAYHKLTAENLKTTDVYLAAGFENLSHFSFAFKKAFGHSPSAIRNATGKTSNHDRHGTR